MPDDLAYPTLEGTVSLLAGFWRSVRADIRNGNRTALLWLESEEFAGWCALCFEKTPAETVRAGLAAQYGMGDSEWTRRA